MTTRVNLLLPIFQINIASNNPEIVIKILQDRYSGFNPSDIYWLQQKDGMRECVVRLDNIKHTLDSIIELIQSKKILEETVNRLKADIFNIVESFSLESHKSALKMQKLKKGLKDQYEDASVSIKIEPVHSQPQEEKKYVDKRLLIAISELTRENIKLKDALSSCQVQLELMQQQKTSQVSKQSYKK